MPTTASPTRRATGLSPQAVEAVSEGLAILLADAFALYMKTKSFHWHVTGPHFRDHHLLLDDQATQILAMTDPIAERARKLGGATLRSIGHISRLQRIADNDSDNLGPRQMLIELLGDNATLAGDLRGLHTLCDQHGDIATASLIENWLDETEQRVWFLTETTQDARD